jgi:hypothetical protein
MRKKIPMKFARFAFSVVVAAVLFAPASPTLAGNSAKRLTTPEKVDICHVVKNGSAKLISVSVNASMAHTRHGDNVPGGSVAGLDNVVYDDTCTPVEIETGPATGCYDSTFFFDLKLEDKLGKKDNAAFSNTLDGTCSGTEDSMMTVVDGADAADARNACVAIGASGTAVMNAGVFGFDTLPKSAWFC